eukprot:87075-Karenia_brevis.AAC.1
MDQATSWSKCFDWPFPHCRLDECNLVLHVDGGTRKGSCSASAWLLDVGVFRNGTWDVSHFAMGGTYHDSPLSSFYAESLALAEGTLFLSSAVRNLIFDRPLGKRRRTLY